MDEAEREAYRRWQQDPTPNNAQAWAILASRRLGPPAPRGWKRAPSDLESALLRHGGPRLLREFRRAAYWHLLDTDRRTEALLADTEDFELPPLSEFSRLSESDWLQIKDVGPARLKEIAIFLTEQGVNAFGSGAKRSPIFREGH